MSGRDRRKVRRMLEVIANDGGPSRPHANPTNGLPATGETPVQPSERRPPRNPNVLVLPIERPAEPDPRPRPFPEGGWGSGQLTIRMFSFPARPAKAPKG